MLVWLEAIGNQGVKVDICNNWAWTNADGVAQFPTAYLNKAGGYTIIARTTGTSSVNGDIPLVPAGQSVLSPLVNVKNGNPGTLHDVPSGRYTADDPRAERTQASGTLSIATTCKRKGGSMSRPFSLFVGKMPCSSEPAER